MILRKGKQQNTGEGKKEIVEGKCWWGGDEREGKGGIGGRIINTKEV